MEEILLSSQVVVTHHCQGWASRQKRSLVGSEPGPWLSSSGPGRVRSTETRQPKAMGVDPRSPFNLNVQKGEEKN